MPPRRARDRRQVAVGGITDGRPSTFDGNYTRTLVSWLMPMPGTPFEELGEKQYDQLMEWTIGGHLAWCVFPIDNL